MKADRVLHRISSCDPDRESARAIAGDDSSLPTSVWFDSRSRILDILRHLSRPPPCRSSFAPRSEEHTSELQSLMRISYAVFCLKKKNHYTISLPKVILLHNLVHNHTTS